MAAQGTSRHSLAPYRPEGQRRPARTGPRCQYPSMATPPPYAPDPDRYAGYEHGSRNARFRRCGRGRAMSTPLGSRVRDLLDRAVAAGILTAEQAAAVTALDTTPDGAGAAPAVPPRHRGAVLAEVLGYVGGTLAVGAALFLGAELWDVLGPEAVSYTHLTLPTN